MIEKRALQAVVAILAAVPLLAGISGVAAGPSFLGVEAPWPADLDSHLRYLSGVLLAMAIGWYSCIPAIETKSARFRLLAAIVVIGGLARLWSLVMVGSPSAGHLGGLAIELVAAPLMVIWQARVARLGLRT